VNRSCTNCDAFGIVPFYDDSEKGSEIVSINFDVCQFDYEFLEPVAQKLAATNISWSIGREDGKLIFNLY
jgi:hypothetical protein